MTATTTTTQALIGWINETRLNAPVLDNDADALLARINAAQAREQAIERAMTRQSSIGLYGHSQSAKAHLLLSLCGSGNGRLNVTPGQRTFDYFSHINPGHALTNMAVRFTRETPEVSDEAFPLRLSLGLYRGEQIRLPLLEAIRGYVPPPPPPPPGPVQHVAPDVIRLDSMSLFDTGKWVLKPGSTKRLVSSLMDIKARPGWLIVVAGHTDSVGEEKANQLLSLKRAESVRDWMRDTGDVPDSCFAVQGYGESRPIATNDTPEGRALNRRVEISLVPQVDACRLPDQPSASSQDDGASLHNGE